LLLSISATTLPSHCKLQKTKTNSPPSAFAIVAYAVLHFHQAEQRTCKPSRMIEDAKWPRFNESKEAPSTSIYRERIDLLSRITLRKRRPVWE
jgi:hypothetical protein